MKKSKFGTLSQFASKATGGVYGSQAHQAPSLPPSTTGLSTPNAHPGSSPHTPRAPGTTNGNTNGNGNGHSSGQGSTMDKKRATWADRVREKMPPLEENEYEVLWERGVLGVIFLESEKDGIPYVSKATESCISPLVAPGDILKFVNVVRSKDHSFSDFFKILATMKKPVLLRFERPSKSRPASPDDTETASAAEPLDQRSTSTHDMGGARSTMKEAARALAARVHRSNSVPQGEKPPPTKPVTRGTFWRASSAKEPPQAASVAPPLTPALATPSRREMKSPVVNLDYDDLSEATDSSSPRWDEESDRYGSDDFQQIEVFWETGPLGLYFGEERGTGYPVVTRSMPDKNPQVYRLVRVHDVLLSANGIRSADFKFDAFFARLQQMSKPVKLVFRRDVDSAGTPPPLDKSEHDFVEEPLKLHVPAATAQPKSEAESSRAEITPRLRPTRLPQPGSPHTQATPDTCSAPSPSAVPQNRGGNLRQNPSPSSKPRSPMVETRSLMDDNHKLSNGTSADARSSKSPSSRPDIVYLGSPKKTKRQAPPSPPPRIATESTPSPKAASQHVPSPTDRSTGRTSQKQKHGKSSNEIFDLGTDYAHAPSVDEVEEDDDLVHAEHDHEVHTAGVEEVGQVIEEGIAVGVPVEPSDSFREHHHAVEATEVTEIVLAVALGDAVSSSREEPLGSQSDGSIEVGLPVSDNIPSDGSDAGDEDDSDETSSQTSTESDSDEGEPLDSIEQEDPDISGDLDNNAMLTTNPKNRGSAASPAKPNKSALNASLAKYRKKSKNSRPLVKLPIISEDTSQTVPLAAPNAVNTNVQVRGRSKPKPSLVETPDSSTYLVKWKEGRSVGLQLREVRFAKGTFPLVVDVCKKPCCDMLKHVCIGDVIVEINGRNCSTMGVKKTVNFLKTSSKTMLLKFRRGPAFMNERVSAYA